MEAGKRSFTIDQSEVKLGEDSSSRYIARTPLAAAAKAARRIFANVTGKKQEVRFTLRETTQDSKGKLYKYIALKQKLDKPKVVNLNGNEVTYNHTYKVKSCKI
jgi:hypothetical protein